VVRHVGAVCLLFEVAGEKSGTDIPIIDGCCALYRLMAAKIRFVIE
jgi:hypothetical protein